MPYRPVPRIPPDLAPAPPAYVTRPFDEILNEARTRYELDRAVPVFWARHVDRRMATDTRLKANCYYSDHADGDDAYTVNDSSTGGVDQTIYGPGRWDASHHRYKLKPRLWPLALNYVCLFVLVVLTFGIGWFAGVGFLGVYAGIALMYAMSMREPNEEQDRPGYIPPEAWMRWWGWHAFLPLALCWSTKEAVAWHLNKLGWKRPPFDQRAEIERMRQDPANRAYLDWARQRLAELDRLSASVDLLSHLADMVRYAINRVETVEGRYFSTVTAHHELSGRPTTSADLESEESLRHCLGQHYVSLATCLAEAEAFAASAASPDSAVVETAVTLERKRWN